MDGKIGIIIGLAAGALLGAGGMFIAKTPTPEPDADLTADKIVVTQIVERVVHIPAPAQPNAEERTAEVAAADAEQPFTFNPADGGPGGGFNRGTNSFANRTPEEWRAEWSNRAARFQAEWTNRAAADRTNFIAVAKLSEDQAVRFDVLMTAMNVRLATSLDPLVAEMQAGKFPRLNAEERARLAMNVGSALATTYDEMNRAMPSDWSQTASSNHVSLSHFIQPQYQPFTRMITSSGRGGPPGGFDRGRGGNNRGPGGGGGNTQAQPAAGAAK